MKKKRQIRISFDADPSKMCVRWKIDLFCFIAGSGSLQITVTCLGFFKFVSFSCHGLRDKYVSLMIV